MRQPRSSKSRFEYPSGAPDNGSVNVRRAQPIGADAAALGRRLLRAPRSSKGLAWRRERTKNRLRVHTQQAASPDIPGDPAADVRSASTWQRWVHRPQRLFLRRALFQVHLWTGVGLGLYMFMIGLTGSILVYRNELSRYFSPEPVVVEGSGEPLSVEAITDAARRAYPGYRIGSVQPGASPNHAVEVNLSRGDTPTRRIFHPFTGADLGDPLPAGYRFTKWMLDLHDNLLAGETGRRVNGIGAVFLLVLCATGTVIWWPGADRWRRSLSLDIHANWSSLNWSLHSAFGAWLMLFSVMWGITGAYLSYPAGFQELFDWIEPLDEANPVERVVDRIMYWLAYLHFGRLGGRGIPYCSRGLCETMTKATWASIGMVLPLLFGTGLVMWWNRVVRPAMRRADRVKSTGHFEVAGR